MTRCSKSLGNKARSIRRLPTSGEGGIRTRGPAFDRTRELSLFSGGVPASGAKSGAEVPLDGLPADLAALWPLLSDEVRQALRAWIAGLGEA